MYILVEYNVILCLSILSLCLWPLASHLDCENFINVALLNYSIFAIPILICLYATTFYNYSNNFPTHCSKYLHHIALFLGLRYYVPFLYNITQLSIYFNSYVRALFFMESCIILFTMIMFGIGIWIANFPLLNTWKRSLFLFTAEPFLIYLLNIMIKYTTKEKYESILLSILIIKFGLLSIIFQNKYLIIIVSLFSLLLSCF